MNPLRHIRRIVASLAGLAAAVLLATPAFARVVPNPADAYPGHVAPAAVPAQIQYRTVVAGGMHHRGPRRAEVLVPPASSPRRASRSAARPRVLSRSPPGRASGTTRSAGIYPVRQMLAAAGKCMLLLNGA
jgi:hypothetical protein